MHRPLEIPIMTSATCTNKKGTQPKLRPHTVFLVSIKFSNEIHGVCFYPALPCFLRHDIFLLVCRFCFQTNGKPFFSSSSRSVFCCRGQVSASVNLLFLLDGNILSWCGVCCFSTVRVKFRWHCTALSICSCCGNCAPGKFNKGLKIVWIKTKLAASADNLHSSFLSERQLPCLADTGSVLPAAVFNPPCRGISTFHICHGTLQSLRCMAASSFLVSPLRAVPSSSG